MPFYPVTYTELISTYLMNKHIPYLLVIIVLFLIIGINRCGDEPQKITEKVVSDSTVVDSLTKHIEYLEALPPDTVEVQVLVPSEPDTVYKDSTGANVREYSTVHMDSMITAKWTTKTTGELRGQDFTYILKNRLVQKEIITKYLTRTRIIRRTMEADPRGFLAVGGEVGASPEQLSLSPIIRYQSKDGYSYHYRYDVISQSHNVGLTIPIRIKIPFLR